ncbi:MAG: hypothetical protein WC455_25790 [Dehalococcoidia bacterium]|jgi:hypothetical protein
MNENQLLDAVSTLTAAAEQRVRAEVERTQAEQQRISLEQHKLKLEQENNAILCRILQETLRLTDKVGQYSSEDHDNMLGMLESILALTQVIALRVGGSDYDKLMDTIRHTREGGNKVQITMGDQATVGNIVEGIQNNAAGVNEALRDLITAINTDDPANVELALNTLPTDIVDVVLAAIQGPLVAARMIAQKVAHKWVVTRSK